MKISARQLLYIPANAQMPNRKLAAFPIPLVFHQFFYGIVIRAKRSLSRLGLLGLGGHAVMLLNVAAKLLVWCVGKSSCKRT
jgi:hypothetical protein